MADTHGAPTPHARTASSRRRWLWGAGALAVVVVGVVLYWFQPHKLFIDDEVNEAIPTVSTSPTTTSAEAPSDDAGEAPEAAPSAAEPLVLMSGTFVSRDHGTSGVVRVLELSDGSRIVRLEGLDTDNGPDLFVYLSTNPADGDEGAFDDDFANLGRLKGNKGDQNYELTPDVDPSRFASVVIWCDRFDSAFGAADLAATAS